MRIVTLILLAAIAGCSSLFGNEEQTNDESVVNIQEGQITYDGRITQETVAKLFYTYKSAGEKPKRLVISSTGGDVSAGMDLGNWVHENNLEVEVANVCASSCANYVFPAGKVKYLHKDSVLIWHGSAWQKDWEVDSEYAEEFAESLKRMRKEESAFFESLQVDNLITVYGQLEFTFWDYLGSLFSPTIGYDYSISDMERFGINRIILIDEEWDWRKYKPNKQDKVDRVKVSENYEFKLNRFEN